MFYKFVYYYFIFKTKIHIYFLIIAKHRLEQFTLSRSEWCISRQRPWGVPIPVFYESETDVPLLTDSSVKHVIEIFKKHGSDGWWKLDNQELLAPEYKNNGNYN
jgi:isoleucyl-tRNA synthetase